MKIAVFTPRISVFLLAALGVLVGTAGAQPQRAPVLRTDRIQLSGARPAMQVLDALEAKYGWHITYEEPPYLFAGDLVDRTHPDYRKANPNVPGFWAARWKPLEVAVDTLANTLLPDREEVMQRLVDAHITSGNPGILRWRKVGDVIDVYPAMVRDVYGTLKPLGSILDSAISFPPQTRNCIQELQLILAETSRASGWNTVMGIVPFNALRQASCNQGATNESARSVLTRAFEEMNAWRKANGSDPIKITWRLLFQPVEKTYFFSAHIVTIQRPHLFVHGKTIPEAVK